MKRILFLMLLISSTYASEESREVKIQKCFATCMQEYRQMLTEVGFQNADEDDIWLYHFPIVKKTHECFDKCRAIK